MKKHIQSASQREIDQERFYAKRYDHPAARKTNSSPIMAWKSPAILEYYELRLKIGRRRATKYFSAFGNEKALEFVRKFLGIAALTEKSFRNEGGIELTCRGRRIYPPPKQS